MTTVARESGGRRRGKHAGRPSQSAPVSLDVRARTDEVQRQEQLTAFEKKQFELVCEVMPDWSNSEIMAFLQKCSFDMIIINEALMNIFEDRRTREDPTIEDWVVQRKKERRKKEYPVPGSKPSEGQRRGGVADRSDGARYDRSHGPRQYNGDRRPGGAPPKREPTKPLVETASTSQWGPSSGGWGETQPTLPSNDATSSSISAAPTNNAWNTSTGQSSSPAASSSASGGRDAKPAPEPTTFSQPASGWDAKPVSAASNGWETQPDASLTDAQEIRPDVSSDAPAGCLKPASEPVAASGWDSAPSSVTPSSGADSALPLTTSSSTAAPAPPLSGEPKRPDQPKSLIDSSTSWATIMKRGLKKETPPEPQKKAAAADLPAVAPAAAAAEAPPATSANKSTEEVVTGTWSSPEPACPVPATEPTTVESSDAAPPDVQAEMPELVNASAEDPEAADSRSDQLEPESESSPQSSQPMDDLLTSPEPVILPKHVVQQAASVDSTMIQFGNFSIASGPPGVSVVSPNAECVRAHSSQADSPAYSQTTNQQLLQQHGMPVEEVSGDVRNHQQQPQQYVTDSNLAVHQPVFYPPHSMHPYVAYETDPSGMPTAYFDPYAQQRMNNRQRPSNFNARNQKSRRDHRPPSGPRAPTQQEDASSSVQSPDGTGGVDRHTTSPNYVQGAGGSSDRDSHTNSKQGHADPSARSGNAGPRGNKQRHHQGQQGGARSAYHAHPGYAAGPIPVGYAPQAYGYPPYMHQYYTQNQQAYGPPGFRQFQAYQAPVGYQGAYPQGSLPRSTYINQTDFLGVSGVHQATAFAQQGEAPAVAHKSDQEHLVEADVMFEAQWHQMQEQQHRHLVQQQQQQQQPNEFTAESPEGPAVHQGSFDRQSSESSPVQQPTFAYSHRQNHGYSQQQQNNYQDFANRHQPATYGETSGRDYQWTQQ